MTHTALVTAADADVFTSWPAQQKEEHNILGLAALEHGDFGAGHPNILGFDELPGRATTTTSRTVAS